MIKKTSIAVICLLVSTSSAAEPVKPASGGSSTTTTKPASGGSTTGTKPAPPAKCSDGSMPVCTDKLKPACKDKTIPAGTPPTCTDKTQPVCTDGKGPTTCPDGAAAKTSQGSTTTKDDSKFAGGTKPTTKTESGPAKCSDGKPPSCTDLKPPGTCADKSTPAGAPMMCTDKTRPTCVGGGKPATCRDGKTAAEGTSKTETVKASDGSTQKKVVQEGPSMCKDGKMPTCKAGGVPAYCVDKSTPTGKPPKCTDGTTAGCSSTELKPEKCADGSSPSSTTKIDKTVVDGKTGLATKTETEVKRGATNCTDGSRPLCSEDKSKPTCTANAKLDMTKKPPACPDGKPQACKDTKPANYCADGSDPASAKVEKQVQKGPALCNDQKAPTCTDGKAPGTCKTGTATGTPPKCDDGSIPACVDKLPPTKCADGSSARENKKETTIIKDKSGVERKVINETKSGSTKCTDGSMPLCVGSVQPNICKSPATYDTIKFTCSDGKPAACGSASAMTRPNLCKDGSDPSKATTVSKKETGPAKCADGAFPTCAGGKKPLICTIAAVESAATGTPPACSDGSRPACTTNIPPAVCADGSKAKENTKDTMKIVDSRGVESTKITETKQGPTKCENGDMPYCSDKKKPGCTAPAKLDFKQTPVKCTDGKEPACSDGKKPATCADGKKAVNSTSKTVKEIGPKACKDGKTPTCKNLQAPKICADGTATTGTPPKCADDKPPKCTEGSPSTCSDGSSAVAAVKERTEITDSKGNKKIQTKETSLGASSCADGKPPLCADGTKPAQSDSKAAIAAASGPLCADKKKPSTCADGVDISKSVETKTVERGAAQCSDGNFPLCTGGIKPVEGKCTDKKAPTECKDGSRATEVVKVRKEIIDSTGKVRTETIEIKQGASKCADGGVPLCSDKKQPSKCTVGVAVKGKCSDNKPPSCADGKKPSTCKDGKAPAKSEEVVKTIKGAKLCSDGKAPTCSGGTKAESCKDDSKPAGTPPLCKNSDRPTCIDFLPPSTCVGGVAPVASEKVEIKTTDAKGRQSTKTIDKTTGITTEIKKGAEKCTDGKAPSCASGAKPSLCKLSTDKINGFPPTCESGDAPTCVDKTKAKCQDGSAAKASVEKIVQDSKTGVITKTSESRDGKTVQEVIGQKKCTGGSLPACADKLPASMCPDDSIPEGTPPVCNNGKKALCTDKLPPKCADGGSGVAKVTTSVTDTKTGEVTKTVKEGAKVVIESSKKLKLCPDGEAPACGDNSTARTCIDTSVPRGSPLICKSGAQPVCKAGNKEPTKCADAAVAKVIVVVSNIVQDSETGTTTVTTTKGDIKEVQTIKKEGAAKCKDGSLPGCVDLLPPKAGKCSDKSEPSVCSDKSAPIAKAVVTTARTDSKTGVTITEEQKVEAAITKDGEIAVVKAEKPKAKADGSGEVGFRCEIKGDSARISCGEGYCCGEGTPAGYYNEDGTVKDESATKKVVETCQKNGATAYVHRPSVGAPQQWDFKCIVGARALAVSATAFLGAVLMME